MPSFKKVSSADLGKYFPNTPPTFTGGSPADGGSSNITANGLFTTVFDADSIDALNRGAIIFSSSGSLPPGFSFNASTGVLSGTYTLQGINQSGANYNFNITATEGNPQLPIKQSVTRSFTLVLNVPWKYRQVVSTGYMAGGYQNSSLWSNVNRVTHSTDTTTNLGDGRIQNYHYKSGATTLDRMHIWNGGFVTAFNMRTESRQDRGSINFNGGNTGTIWEPDREFAWVNGEGCSQWRRWQFSNESITSNRGSGFNSHMGSISGEDRGIGWDNGGYTQRFLFSTESAANAGSSAGAHGQQKGLSSKDDKGYGGNQGSYNGGNQFRVTNTSNESRITIVGKPFGNMGEENYGHGQDKGYCIGTYDGSQNNRSFILTYSTNSGFETGGTTQPKGHGGCSSGHMGFRN